MTGVISAFYLNGTTWGLELQCERQTKPVRSRYFGICASTDFLILATIFIWGSTTSAISY